MLVANYISFVLKSEMTIFGITIVVRAILKMIILYNLAFCYRNIKLYKTLCPFSLLIEVSMKCLKAMHSTFSLNTLRLS
jgi:hypothetical protein